MDASVTFRVGLDIPASFGPCEHSVAPTVGRTKKLRVCLAGSGGGHLRQLLDLKGFWAAHDPFFITENTPLGRSALEVERTYFVPHFGLGQARQGALFAMVKAAIWNFAAAGAIILRERPDIFVTTGAGAMFFPLVWARLFGAKVVVVESLARIRTLSAFARAVAPLAHKRIVQSSRLRAFWPDATVFDPLRILNSPVLNKERLLFVTVGAVLTFDRLVSMVTELKARGEITHDVLIQCGAGGLQPQGMATVETLCLKSIHGVLRRADTVVCHGGTGSIVTALQHGCRVVAVPRSALDGEVYDDHQREIVDAFRAKGLIEVANTPDELIAALERMRVRPPITATADLSEMAEHLTMLASQWSRTIRRSRSWPRAEAPRAGQLTQQTEVP